MSEVLEQELTVADIDAPVAALSGPNLAREIAQGLPAASVAAAAAPDARARLRDLFNSPGFRVYTNDDIIGVELGGALKNVIAIAVGIAVALESGDNARAALITRGLAEIARLGAALGANASTLAGLAGMGDLLATAMSPQSRNRALGERIGGGMTPAQALAATANVAEGVETTRAARRLAENIGVSMPISDLVARVAVRAPAAARGGAAADGRARRSTSSDPEGAADVAGCERSDRCTEAAGRCRRRAAVSTGSRGSVRRERDAAPGARNRFRRVWRRSIRPAVSRWSTRCRK